MRKLLAALVAVILVSISVFFGLQYVKLRGELQTLKAQSLEYKFHKDVLEFARNFVDKVLKANQEVSFSDRLRLENMVRDLHDQQVLDQWNKFVESKTEAEAQEQVKILLSLLLSKI